VPLPLACNPAAQNASTSVAATLGATGGTTNINGEPPTYYWTSSNGQTSIGSLFNPTYDTAGIYSVTLADSASDATATCQVYVQ